MGKSYEERVETTKSAGSQDLSKSGWDMESRSLQVSHDIHEVFDEPGGELVQQDEEPALMLQQSLTDPLVNSLDRHSRFYLHHFATYFCDVMVVYDMPGRNPIRDLIPATSTYPLLLHILVANSAFHIFNISRNPMTQSSYQSEQPLGTTLPCSTVVRCGEFLKSSYRDALMAKQQALSLLAQSVATVNESNVDLILVTILMFVNYALVESGRDKWRVHMDGALKLIMLLGEAPYLQRPMSRLRQTILSDFLVFHILGSTFTFSALSTFIPASIELNPILRYAETNNYLSCPAPLLRIMLQSYALPGRLADCAGEVYSSLQDQIGRLLREALGFDPATWAYDFEPAHPSEDIRQRHRIAAAHRSAVCIYLARVLPSTNPLLDPTSGVVSLTALADDVVYNISHLRPGDALFKSICWPLFLAGAESRDPAQREWIMNTLDELYNIMFWGYLHTSKRVLEAIWNYLDDKGDGDSCWVDFVKDLGNEVLIA